MKSFTKIEGIKANLLIDNIDTDMIIPKQFLKTITRSGLGANLFYEMRYKNGGIVSDFVLNVAPFSKANILLTGHNFGCGSSREHAPWALLDFGITCIVAESFADIFYNNCFENGILPVILRKEQIMELSRYDKLLVDLERQVIEFGDSDINFDIDEFKKYRLLNGLDSIGLTMEKMNKVKQFEMQQKEQYPWL